MFKGSPMFPPSNPWQGDVFQGLGVPLFIILKAPIKGRFFIYSWREFR